MDHILSDGKNLPSARGRCVVGGSKVGYLRGQWLGLRPSKCHHCDNAVFSPMTSRWSHHAHKATFGKGVVNVGGRLILCRRLFFFLIFFVYCENFAAMVSKEIREIIFNMDSCIGFLRERRVLHTLPPICPECNESMTEEKDSGRGDKRVWLYRSHRNFSKTIRHGSFLVWEHIITYRWYLLWRSRKSPRFIFFIPFCTEIHF